MKKRAKKIYAPLKTNFSEHELTSECVKAIRKGEKAFVKFYISFEMLVCLVIIAHIFRFVKKM